MLSGTAQAAILKIDSISLGKVINLNGQKFVKVRNDPANGSQFVALEEVFILPAGTQPTADCPKSRIIGTMQTWNNCAGLAKPIGTNYTNIGCLVDERDGKPYEIRKFSDGKCWMVDDLKYGGGTDGSADYCASKTSFRAASSAALASATATNGLNPPDGSRNTLVGDCRNNPGTNYGYLYNWPAAIQSASGYNGGSYQPAQPTQGICPVGWHLPTGETSGEFQALHVAVGSSMTGFWQGGNFKGVYSGYCSTTGPEFDQGSRGNYWSSTQNATGGYVHYWRFYSNSVALVTLSSKHVGFAVRCVKN